MRTSRGGGRRGWGRFASAQLALIVTAALAVPAFVQRSANAACIGGRTIRVGPSGVWTNLPGPVFSEGPPEILAHAVDPQLPTRWFATNGTIVVRTDDQWCSYRTVYALPREATVEEPLDRRTDQILGIVVPESSHDQVFVTVAALGMVSPPLGSPLNDWVPPERDGRAVAQTVVMRSRDGGDTWEHAGRLAQPVGMPGPLRVAPTDPNVVYAVAGGTLNASSDGGTTWTSGAAAADPSVTLARTLNPDSRRNVMYPDLVPQVAELAVDALDPNTVWVKSESVLMRSSDGGKSWTTILEVNGYDLHGPEIAARSGAPPQFVLTRSEAPDPAVNTILQSDDGAASWHSYQVSGVQGQLQSMAHGVDELVMTTLDYKHAGAPSWIEKAQGIYRLHPSTGRVENIDDFKINPLFDVQSDRLAEPSYYFRHYSGLAIFTSYVPDREPSAGSSRGGSREGDEPVRTIEIPPFDPPVPAPPPSPTLRPARTEIRVKPGETRTVSYQLDLPARPTPLDVFFLIDSSGSMDPVIADLAEDLGEITRRLATSGVDAQFGLGEFQGSRDQHDVRYRRRADIRPPDQEFQHQLATMTTRGGRQEPHLTALHQMATGSGIPNPTVGQAVPPGQQANWRPGSLRVVVMATDETFGTDPDGPTRAATVAALNAKGIHHIGIEALGTDGEGNTELGGPGADEAEDALEQTRPEQQRVDKALGRDAGKSALLRQLEGISDATGTLAPRGGVDCDGDGQIDIDEGKPLACPYRPNGRSRFTVLPRGEAAMADLLLRLLTAIVDRQPVSLSPRGAGTLGVKVAPGNYPSVNVKDAHRLGFNVTFSCSGEHAGATWPFDLLANVGRDSVAKASVTLVCGALPAAPAPPAQEAPPPPFAQRPVPMPAPPGPILAPALVPPPLVPAPVTMAEVPVTAPAPASSQAQASQAVEAPASGQATSTSPVTASRPATAAVVAPQPQVAPAVQTQESDTNRSLQAVARRQSRNPQGVVTAGMVMWAAAVIGLRRRIRISLGSPR